METIVNLKPSDKLTLSIKETAEYSGIAELRLKQIIEENPQLNWVIKIGVRTRIKREEFETWFKEQEII